jgi:hypothetical protein
MMRNMGTPDQHSPPLTALLRLGGLVVVVAAVSLVVTMHTRPNVTPAAEITFPNATPEPTPSVCRPDQLRLVGAFNDCTSLGRTNPSMCSISAHALEATLYLSGTRGDSYRVDLTVPTYIGAGAYKLSNGSAVVIVRQIASTAFWQATTGRLTVTAHNGRDGDIDANLTQHDVSKGGAQSALVPLHVEGPWSCG